MDGTEAGQRGTMTNTGDEYGTGGFPNPGHPATGPEQWLGAPDPVESFGSTIDQALQRLTIELAGLRAERDGMRLELEGLRTQLQVTQQQLGDRERFSATVRELGNIVQQLATPTRWAGDPAAAAAAQALAANPFAPPPPAYPPPGAPYVPPAYAPPTYAPPVAYSPPPPPPPTYAPPVEIAPAAPPPPTPPTPPAPVAPVSEPLVMPAAAAPAPPEVPVEVPPAPPVPEPAAFVPPAPEPAPPTPEPEPVPPDAVPSSPYSFTSSELPQARTQVVATEESFFSGPGVWIGEPPKADERRGALKTWATRLGSGVAAFIVAVVFLVSIGPKFLPYQMFFVRSGSMHPVFDTGDMVVLTKVDASDLKKGDIITFDRPDKPGTLVTHRIIGISTNASGKAFQTKGDFNDSADPWQVPATGTGWKYKAHIPKLGFLFGYLGTPQARLALLAIPATLLGLLSIIDIWKPHPKARGRR
jgi:signal peptidase I